jgi:hypothetical protein
MKPKLILCLALVLSSGLVGCSINFHAVGANIIPAELVGEWVDENAKFQNDELASGCAFYINTNGVAVCLIEPEVGPDKWHATYNPANHLLVLVEDSNPGMPYNLIYDSKTKTLNAKDGISFNTLKRHRDYVPSGYLNVP